MSSNAVKIAGEIYERFGIRATVGCLVARQAGGGKVPCAGARSDVSLGNELLAPEQVFGKVLRAARSRKIRSAGKKPGW